MIARNRSDAARELGEHINAWATAAELRGVVFRENRDPPQDTDDDYAVCYEAVFEPSSLRTARLEIWVCDDGRVAIGFETRDRIAKRLNVRNRTRGFAAGNEPLNLSTKDVLWVVELASKGNISVAACSIPLLGLLRVEALVPSIGTDEDEIERANRLGWLRLVPESAAKLHSAVKFHPWAESLD